MRIEAKEDALSTRIRISDDGPGIAAEDLPHVFERFYRGRSDAEGRAEGESAGARNGSVEPKGFGIGLSLAQALVSAQGGSLRARNLPEGGACFEIAFPKMNV